MTLLTHGLVGWYWMVSGSPWWPVGMVAVFVLRRSWREFRP